MLCEARHTEGVAAGHGHGLHQDTQADRTHHIRHLQIRTGCAGGGFGGQRCGIFAVSLGHFSILVVVVAGLG